MERVLALALQMAEVLPQAVELVRELEKAQHMDDQLAQRMVAEQAQHMDDLLVSALVVEQVHPLVSA
jgi:hypothetical protein